MAIEMDLTVAIPTYNGAERIPAVLEYLRRQIVPSHRRWEILIVDNNSQDQTAQLVQTWQATWNLDVPLRYCCEPRQGLAYARMQAVRQAQGALVGFIDDDNWPDPHWVAAACDFGEQYPQAGVFGSQIKAQLDSEPPPYFKDVQSFLVIRNYSSQAKLYDPIQLRLPAGAGLVVRRQAWIDGMPQQPLFTGRGGDDYEISLNLHRQGWQIWHNPAMVIEHHLPAQRLEREYLCAIAYQYGLCTTELLMIVAKPWQRPLILLRNFLGAGRRLITHWFRHRTVLESDPNAACHLAFHLGSVLSPWMYLKQQILLFIPTSLKPE